MNEVQRGSVRNAWERGQERETEKTRELPELFVETLLRESRVVDQGQDGIILRLDMEAVSPELLEGFGDLGIVIEGESAVKLLKMYRPGSISEEFDAQKQAHSLLGSGDADIAGVPTPYVYGTFNVGEQIKESMPVFDHLDKAELMLMEWVPGSDVETQLYRKAHDILFPEEISSNLDLDYMRRNVAISLKFEDDLDAHRVMPYMINTTGNAKRLMRFLAKNDQYVSPDIIEQIESACKKMNHAGLYHDDLHGRNIIVNGDMFANDGLARTFIIDFGRAQHRDSANDLSRDDAAIAQVLSFGNTLHEQRRAENSIVAEQERELAKQEKVTRANQLHETVVLPAIFEANWRERRKDLWKKIVHIGGRVNEFNVDVLVDQIVDIIYEETDGDENRVGEILDLAGLISSRFQIPHSKLKESMLRKALYINEIKLYLDYHKRDV